MSKIKFTQSGLDKMKLELQTIEGSRPEAVAELKFAREMGDLSENAAYKVARQKISRIDSRIRYLNKIIAQAQVVEMRDTGRVEIGCNICVECDGNRQEFQIVGGHEVDIQNKKISFFSPLGSAFLNKKINDVVEVKTPIGIKKYIIISIFYI